MIKKGEVAVTVVPPLAFQLTSEPPSRRKPIFVEAGGGGGYFVENFSGFRPDVSSEGKKKYQ